MTFAGPSAAPGDLCKPLSPNHLEATDRAGRLHRARPTPCQKTVKPQSLLRAVAEPKVGGALREPWTTFQRHNRPGNSDSAYFPFDSGLLSVRVAAIKGEQGFSCGNRHKALGGRRIVSIRVVSDAQTGSLRHADGPELAPISLYGTDATGIQAGDNASRSLGLNPRPTCSRSIVRLHRRRKP